jgi:polysaccharide export outer membrane protein
MIGKQINWLFSSSEVLACGFLIACTVFSGAVAGQTSPPEPVRGSAVANQDYKIGPGDILDVIVSKNDTLSRAGLRVGNNGMIQLAMMDDEFLVACLTEKQAADMIREKYRKYLVDPHVNVAVREFNSNPVAVLGAVNSPGRFHLQRSIRLSELLTLVNGPNPKAGESIEIIRDLGRPACDGDRFLAPAGGDRELLTFNLAEVLKGGEQSDPVIVPGDIVKVDEFEAGNAYIQGNVKSTAAISLKEPVTLSQAIAMVGGPSAGAQLDKVVIRRQVVGSLKRDEIIVNVKEINQRKREDVLLRPNDIIDVPGPSGGKKIWGDIMRTLMPSIVRLPVSTIPY